jgi:hypothetical protein
MTVVENQETKLNSLKTQELFLRAQLIEPCLTLGNPRTNKLFTVHKRMAMGELFERHASEMPKELVAAFAKLCKLRQVLIDNGIELSPL